MYQVKCLNKISPLGTSRLGENYHVGEDVENPDAILVRSAAMHDMEFNKNGEVKKELPGNIKSKSGGIRPDIIVHTRMKELEHKYKHYIVIEAKRSEDSKEDKDVVTRFIKSEEFGYKVGVTINYNKFNPIKATLYYKNDKNNIEHSYLKYPDMQV